MMQKGKLRFAGIGGSSMNNARVKFYCSLPVRTEYGASRFLELVAMNNFVSVKSVLSLFGIVNLYHFKDFLKEKAIIRSEKIGETNCFEIEDFETDRRSRPFCFDNTQSSNYRERFGEYLTRETLKVARFIRNGGRLLVPLLSDSYIGQNESLGLVFGLSGGEWKLITYGKLANAYYGDKLYFADHSVDEIISRTRKIPFESFKGTIPVDLSYTLKTEARFSLPMIGIEGSESVVAPIVIPLAEEPEEIEIKNLVYFYITNMKNEVVTSVKVGTRIYLNVETQNLIGETMDLQLNTKEADFEYEGERLENDTLKDYTIGSVKEKVLLKVIRPEVK